MTLRVALTGGIATGKSYCLRRFAALGADVIDADRLARDAVAPGTPGLAAVLSRFGSGVLGPGGVLNRKALARIVFGDPAARRDLEAIVHPLVYAAIQAWFSRLAAERAPAPAASETPRVGIADVPLLYETGHAGDFDYVIVAACPVAEQRRRVIVRDGVTGDEADRRITAQLPIEAKRARADFVIDTSGTFDHTNHQIDTVWARLSTRPG